MLVGPPLPITRHFCRSSDSDIRPAEHCPLRRRVGLDVGKQTLLRCPLGVKKQGMMLYVPRLTASPYRPWWERCRVQTPVYLQPNIWRLRLGADTLSSGYNSATVGREEREALLVSYISTNRGRKSTRSDTRDARVPVQVRWSGRLSSPTWCVYREARYGALGKITSPKLVNTSLVRGRQTLLVSLTSRVF